MKQLSKLYKLVAKKIIVRYKSGEDHKSHQKRYNKKMNKHLKEIKKLIKKVGKKQLNKSDSTSYPVLFCAKHYEVIELLLDNGAKYTYKDNKGKKTNLLIEGQFFGDYKDDNRGFDKLRMLGKLIDKYNIKLSRKDLDTIDETQFMNDGIEYDAPYYNADILHLVKRFYKLSIKKRCKSPFFCMISSLYSSFGAWDLNTELVDCLIKLHGKKEFKKQFYEVIGMYEMNTPEEINKCREFIAYLLTKGIKIHGLCHTYTRAEPSDYKAFFEFLISNKMKFSFEEIILEHVTPLKKRRGYNSKKMSILKKKYNNKKKIYNNQKEINKMQQEFRLSPFYTPRSKREYQSILKRLQERHKVAMDMTFAYIECNPRLNGQQAAFDSKLDEIDNDIQYIIGKSY